MINWIRSTLNPAGYHGRVMAKPFFEGWYYKLVDPAQNARFAIIPGIYLAEDGQADHAFIQVMDGRARKVAYAQYPVSDFSASQTGFDLRIGPNHFNRSEISLDIHSDEVSLLGRVHFAYPAPVPWPVTLLNPGIMGPFGWIPGMECYHGVVSLNHGLEGAMIANGVECNFTGGRGYIEKDWGHAFPKAWVWFQSNHFAGTEACITASVAIIPGMRKAALSLLRRSFVGFIVGFWHAGKLNVFATYNGARMEKLEILADRVNWVLRRGKQTLELTAVQAGGSLLQAPTPTGMDRRIAETLDASVQVRLSEGGRVLFEGTGHSAGLEVIGDLDAALPSSRRSLT